MDPMPPMGSPTPMGRSPSEMSYTNNDQHPAQMQHLQQMQHQRHLNGPNPNEPEIMAIKLVKVKYFKLLKKNHNDLKEK